jgi:hypothetical protein
MLPPEIVEITPANWAEWAGGRNGVPAEARREVPPGGALILQDGKGFTFYRSREVFENHAFGVPVPCA